MNKSNAIRVIAAALAICSVITAYGCKGKSEASPEGELNQASVKNSTAVVRYTSIDSKGKEVDETKVITNVNESAINVGTIVKKLNVDIKKDEDKKELAKEIKEDYKLDDNAAAKIVDDAENWAEFTYSIYVANSNAKKIAFRYIDAKGNDNVKVKSDLDCEYGLPAGVGTTIYFTGIVNLATYPDAEDLQNALAAMDISIRYTVLADGVEDVDDWDAVTTKVMSVSVK